MTNEKQANIYVARLKRCLGAVKILVICAIAAVAALLIFSMAANGAGMKESNYGGMLLGIILIGSIAVLCIIGAVVTVVVAKITVSALKKLPEGDE